MGGHWALVATGTAVGHKRIQPIDPTKTRQLRLRITDSSGTARIRTFAGYETGVAPPPTWNDPAPAWADDDAGVWAEGGFDLDLTPKITAPATYQLRFVGQGGLRT